MRVPFACLTILVSTTGGLRSAYPEEATVVDVPMTPLRTLSTVRVSLGDYFAWSGPALCDADENVYFLVPPRSPAGEVGGSIAGAGVPHSGDVLRVSADGKTRTTFTAGSKFVGAEDVTTMAMALDADGRLFTLVWARWVEKGSQAEKGRQ